MVSGKGTISACLVVYNEEAVIERCLKSIAGLVDEIIVVHDGECRDKTLEIAKKYTDKVFVRDHAGMMEAHLVYAFNQASREWLLRIDADEFFDEADLVKIKDLVKDESTDAYIFKWEMWNGKETISFPGLQKMCLVRREKFHYAGIPHENGSVDGLAKKVDLTLRHRPAYNNIAWSSFMRKTKKWAPVHAKYFFPEQTPFDCFNTSAEPWLKTAKETRANIWRYLLLEPFRMSLGQLKNGLWKSRYGIQVCLERYVYYVLLYWHVFKMQRRLPKV